MSAEYGPGAGVLRVEGLEPGGRVDGLGRALTNHYATSVQPNGILYGFHGRQEFGPSLRAVELRTGKVRWSQEQFRAGSILLAGTRLLIMREGGELVLADGLARRVQAAGARAGAARGRCAPSRRLSDGILYVRNENTLVALDLRK